MEDLRKGIIRTIGDPNERFKQDPVRMIRVIRHAARTGFAIDPAAYQAIIEHRDEIKKCSPSRVRDEFVRDLKEGASQPCLNLMLQTGLLFSLSLTSNGSSEIEPCEGKGPTAFLILFRPRGSARAGGKTCPDPSSSPSSSRLSCGR